MRIRIFFFAYFGVVFIAQAAADDPAALLMGKHGEYPGNPVLCKKLIEHVHAGVDLAADCWTSALPKNEHGHNHALSQIVVHLLKIA